MKKQIVRVEMAHANPNLSPATRFGNLVFVAGQTGRTSLDNVLSAMTHLTRREDLAAYNEEYAKYFPADKPARTTVTVASLNAPELLVEITVTACIPD
jgi:enamine deaminase RidA (YjgF/YER057c/UK114 family)